MAAMWLGMKKIQYLRDLVEIKRNLFRLIECYYIIIKKSGTYSGIGYCINTNCVREHTITNNILHTTIVLNDKENNMS